MNRQTEVDPAHDRRRSKQRLQGVRKCRLEKKGLLMLASQLDALGHRAQANLVLRQLANVQVAP